LFHSVYGNAILDNVSATGYYNNTIGYEDPKNRKL